MDFVKNPWVVNFQNFTLKNIFLKVFQYCGARKLCQMLYIQFTNIELTAHVHI